MWVNRRGLSIFPYHCVEVTHKLKIISTFMMIKTKTADYTYETKNE